jgi:coproporphyrinogen III oxidase
MGSGSLIAASCLWRAGALYDSNFGCAIAYTWRIALGEGPPNRLGIAKYRRMDLPETPDLIADRKARASDWFRDLRNQICDAFEALEDTQTFGPHAGNPAGRFELRQTKRDAPDGGDAGGGLMSVMRGGRVFEKVGVNVSTVYGTLGDQAQRSLTARKELPGLSDDPRFWASGISLVAHMNSPKCPAVHMNTRMFWTPAGTWFGGGADLNPMVEVPDQGGL